MPPSGSSKDPHIHSRTREQRLHTTRDQWPRLRVEPGMRTNSAEMWRKYLPFTDDTAIMSTAKKNCSLLRLNKALYFLKATSSVRPTITFQEEGSKRHKLFSFNLRVRDILNLKGSKRKKGGKAHGNGKHPFLPSPVFKQEFFYTSGLNGCTVSRASGSTHTHAHTCARTHLIYILGYTYIKYLGRT